MRISDWSSDVCASDLPPPEPLPSVRRVQYPSRMPLDTLVPQAARPTIVASVCPHDCPSACALEVERIDSHTIGRVRGSAANDYTAGVVCAKVARYAERVHHPDRPERRAGGRER